MRAEQVTSVARGHQHREADLMGALLQARALIWCRATIPVSCRG